MVAREKLMERLNLSQENIEKTADRIVSEFKRGTLKRAELPEEAEENITEKILKNQNILISGPRTVGKTIFGKQLLLESIRSQKKCVLISKDAFRIEEKGMLLKRNINNYSHLFFIQVPEGSELFFLPMEILHAGLSLKKIDLVLFDSITHLAFHNNFYTFFEKYLKKTAKLDIQTVLSLTETYDTISMVKKLRHLFDINIRFSPDNTIDVTADVLDHHSYAFSIVKQKVLFQEPSEKESEKQKKSPRDIIKGR